VDAKGAFRIDGLPEGTYTVRCVDEERGMATDSCEAGRADLVLKLGEPVLLRGRVLDADDGRPLANAAVSSDLGPSAAVSGEGGAFEVGASFAAERGQGKVHLRAACAGYRSSWVEVEPGSAAAALRLHRIPSIAGRVVDGENRPVAGAKVWYEVLGIPPA